MHCTVSVSYFSMFLYLLICKACWIANVYELSYIYKLALPLPSLAAPLQCTYRQCICSQTLMACSKAAVVLTSNCARQFGCNPFFEWLLQDVIEGLWFLTKCLPVIEECFVRLSCFSVWIELHSYWMSWISKHLKLAHRPTRSTKTHLS